MTTRTPPPRDAGGERPAPVVGVVCVTLEMGGDVMRVEKLMDLWQLAELMGSETTEREAELMRQFLNDDDYYDTDDVSESEWLQMIQDAVEFAEAEAKAVAKAVAARASAKAEAEEQDGGPTESDLSGEVDHG